MVSDHQSWSNRTHGHMGLVTLLHCNSRQQMLVQTLRHACSQAKAAGPASAEPSLLRGPRPYFDPMWKHLTRPATPCGVQHQVVLAASFAPGLIPGLLLVFGTPQFLLRSHLLYISHLTQPPIHGTKFSSRPPECPQALISCRHALHAAEQHSWWCPCGKTRARKW